MGGEIRFEIYNRNQYYCGARFQKADQYCMTVLIAEYRQKRKCCFHNFLMVDFHRMVELRYKDIDLRIL